MKLTAILIILVICMAIIGLWHTNRNEAMKNSIENNSSNNNTVNKSEINDEERDEFMIELSVNGRILNIKLENNSSSIAFIEKLKEGEVIVNADDYGNFEKVGDLGFSLPTNDEEITTEAGDLILYQGNQITLYYDTNTWNFTKLGKVQNITQEELKQILGEGAVTLKFYIPQKEIQ